MPRARKPLAAAATPAATKPTGGKIEVLGTTRSLRNIAQSTDQKAANSQPATVKRETSR